MSSVSEWGNLWKKNQNGAGIAESSLQQSWEAAEEVSAWMEPGLLTTYDPNEGIQDVCQHLPETQNIRPFTLKQLTIPWEQLFSDLHHNSDVNHNCESQFSSGNFQQPHAFFSL